MLHERMTKRAKMIGVILWPQVRIKMMMTYG
jgi:hypothetical protein